MVVLELCYSESGKFALSHRGTHFKTINYDFICDTKSIFRVISANDDFDHDIAVKVQNITIKESEPERRETKTRVDENRKYVIEATIVRIMKARKILSHNLLIAEVTEQLKSRFMPTPQMIKQRIESLLERDYLARSEDDKKTYRYLA